jgi:hypothetical protein
LLINSSKKVLIFTSKDFLKKSHFISKESVIIDTITKNNKLRIIVGSTSNRVGFRFLKSFLFSYQLNKSYFSWKETSLFTPKQIK